MLLCQHVRALECLAQHLKKYNSEKAYAQQSAYIRRRAIKTNDCKEYKKTARF